MKRSLLLGVLVAAGLGLAAGPALAVSDPGYDPARQGCSGAADNADAPDRVEPGCHSTQVAVEDGTGHRYAEAGVDQTPDGTNGHHLTAGADPGTDGPDPSSGLRAYFGADDNLDSGEHDSSGFSNNGPSDGGAVHGGVDPATVAAWVAALQAGDTAYLLTHPAPLGAGAGGCADGACASAQTRRGTMYQGTGSGRRDAYDYRGKEWDPYPCGGPTDDAASCGGQDLGQWNGNDGTVDAEPGVQVYEDPDPQGSPLDPLYDGGATPSPTLYPLPSAYVGTCGATAGGGPLWPAGQDQARAETGC
jgi:hypothetical protein